MGLRFIFMLTRNDQTVEDAAVHLDTALRLGIRHIGFKDVGLPIERLKALNRTIRAGGATSYLEVVSLDRESEIASARAALEIGVDMLLGGTHVEEVAALVAGRPVRYCPFPGRISGHPSVLEGSIEEIVASARRLAAHPDVHGLDLLAYRSKENVPALMQAVCAAVSKPVYMAGSIETPGQIAAVKAAGGMGFTIGTAALDGRYPGVGKNVASQLAAVMAEVARLNNHVSPYHKQNLASAFGAVQDRTAPRIAGRINDMQIKLARLEGQAGWHFHQREDALLLVHKGRLRVRFRDRDEVVEEGDFIVVPHGVEHCPEALSEECHVLLIEPPGTSPSPPAGI